jgi:hypothetical protein
MRMHGNRTPFGEIEDEDDDEDDRHRFTVPESLRKAEKLKTEMLKK